MTFERTSPQAGAEELGAGFGQVLGTPAAAASLFQSADTSLGASPAGRAGSGVVGAHTPGATSWVDGFADGAYSPYITAGYLPAARGVHPAAAYSPNP
jgi:hypothetical protein